MVDDSNFFDLTAKVTGRAEEDDKITLTLLEAGGASRKWSTKRDLDKYADILRNHVYTFRVSMSPNPKSAKSPFRNLWDVKGESTEGEMTSSETKYAELTGTTSQQSAPAAPSTNSGGGGRSYMSSEDKAKERASIESQVSLTAILRLIEANWEMDEIKAKLPQILELAKEVETHHREAQQRQGLTNDAAQGNGKPTQASKAPTSKRSTSSAKDIKDVGSFMTVVAGLYPDKAKSDFKKQIEDALGVTVDTIKDFGEALGQLKHAWSPDQPPGE